MQSLWYAMAAFLTCFDVAPVIGEDGTPILPELKFEEGAFRYESSMIPCLLLPHASVPDTRSLLNVVLRPVGQEWRC